MTTPTPPASDSTTPEAPAPAEGPTPRTDVALIDKIRCTEGGDEECTVYPAEEIVDANFARQLERELTACRVGRDEARRMQLRAEKKWDELLNRCDIQATQLADMTDQLFKASQENAALQKQLEEARAECDDAQGQAERERAQRQLAVGAQEYRGNTVSYMYDKAKCYGDMVHGCSVTLDELGFPVDRFAKDGAVGAVGRACKAMGAELTTLRQQVRLLREAHQQIITEHKFCADEKPNSFCSKFCADISQAALAALPPTEQAP